MMFGLEVKAVSKSYGAQAVVNDVSLTVAAGQFVCFLGPSGCGKTTLLRMIAGLETPSTGRILMNGRDVTDMPAHRRNFAMVFQALALFPFLTVEENIAYSLRLRGVDARGRTARVQELLALIRLPDIGQRRIDQLSGGQRQRVAIARALAQEPSLFLMDEPLSALDAKLRDHMQVELRQLQQTLAITTILVTHDQREAMTMADTIVILADGKVQQAGAPTEVYRNPANRFVAGFIGQSNFFDCVIGDPAPGPGPGSGHVRLADQVIPVAAMPAGLSAGDGATLSIRPEDIRVHQPAGGSENGPGRLPGLSGRIVFVRDVGGAVELRIACGGQEVIATTTPSEWAAIAAPGPVVLTLPPGACRILTA